MKPKTRKLSMKEIGKVEEFLPRDYLSHSQKSAYLWSKQRFLDTYYYGNWDENSPFLKMGKMIADALEFREKKCAPEVRAVIDQMPDYPEREYEMRLMFGDIPLLGYLDGFDPKKMIIGEYKTGQKPSMASWREQMLFYSLMVWLKFGKLPKKIELHWARTIFNDDGQLVLTGEVKEYEIKITLPEVLLFAGKLKRIWAEIKDLCEKEYYMFGVLPKSRIKGRKKNKVNKSK